MTICVPQLVDLNRLTIDQASQITPPDPQELIAGLTGDPKTIPAYYFYDDRGSLLFEQICQLPEYYLTRTEAQILRENAETIAQLTQAKQLIELGSGSSKKTRILLSAFTEINQSFNYVPIDISGGMLYDTAQNLLLEYPTLTVHGIVATYQVALRKLPDPPAAGSRLFCFLGSSLGNFTAQESHALFQQITASMNKGDYFLLGVDCHKDRDILYRAYNDRVQVTAEFNRNILAHLNDRFVGNFEVDLFSHQAIYNEQEKQIEMYLISRQPQMVKLQELGLTLQFQTGELIRTEISRKFVPQELCQELQRIGLSTIKVFTDPRRWYALVLTQL
ncbi:MAG: L-histidine N(alpha)-methyltransferase [Pseudanabaenaceae cyanobacterium]